MWPNEAGLLSLREAARLLGRNERTLKRWARHGNFPLRRLGGRNVVLRGELEEALKSLPRVGVEGSRDE
jgi:predicted DNA-binding transcriptional regulator AlpA